jgi:hypothetical protein
MDEDSKYPLAEFGEEFSEMKRIDLFILRTHLYVEHYLEMILDFHLENYEEIDSFRFSQKLRVCKSLGLLDQELLENLKLINRMRNDLVHTLDIGEAFSEKIEPRLQQMHLLAEDREEKQEILSELESDEDHVSKLLLTTAVMNNYVANLEN